MRAFAFKKNFYFAILFCVGTAVAAHAQTYTKLANFVGSNGSAPEGPLVQGTNGNLYGVTNQGGTASNCSLSVGCGTVFEATPGGKVATLYNFCSLAGCADGESPRSGLVLATNGNFYGLTPATTVNGGTIYEITPAGKFTLLYTFCSAASCPNGNGSLGTLMQAANGSLYGVTASGGTGNYCAGGCGTIFQITLAGAYSVFHSFCSTTECTHDGKQPRSGLIQAANGNYVGTTVEGGPSQAGILYEITPAGKLTLLYNFCSQSHCTDGQSPDTPPIQAANGNFYGLAGEVVYEVTPAKQYTSLYTFCSDDSGGQCLDGGEPLGLLQGTDGNFYGAAEFGGNSTLCGSGIGCGVLFEISSSGTFSVLYNLCSVANCTDGGSPSSGLTQATNGMFYGVDGIGGAGSGCLQGFGCGAMYSYSEGLAPFVEANPTLGAAGKVINILGSNLTGTTSVTFNGTSAKFEVISKTYLKAQVPAGATAGTIEVTTPSGTLSSNVAFVVAP